MGEKHFMTRCRVFKSEIKEDTYLYLSADTTFDDLPAELLAQFGEPAFVMALELSPERKLARVEVGNVIAALSDQGFYLQLPPEIPTEEEISRRFSS
jgi:uncharacterized protein YcgL (UPF0745 family)